MRAEHDGCAARCCELLVKRAELLRSPRDFTEHFSPMQETPVECGLLVRHGAASRNGRKANIDAHDSRAGVGIASMWAGKGSENFFV